MDIIVKYNNNILSPTPTVSRSFEFLDYGNRFGQIEQIELNSFITGITGDVQNLVSLASLFAGQFKTLEVLQNSVSIYKWDNIILQEISVPEGGYPQGGFMPYTAKFISYEIPSGVLEPTNEYSFNQSEDGIVTVNHKISAKGVKTTNGALNNAISFVKAFVRKNPYTSCAPVFIPNGSGILISASESIDRTECSYSVSEVYKFITGTVSSNIQTQTLTIDESKTADYPTIELDIRLQGSPVDNSTQLLRTSALNLDLNSVLQGFGLQTTGYFRNSFTINEDTGSALVEIKSSFFSGNVQDYSGFFDYGISYEEDLITNIQSWKIDGDFIVKGPLSQRNSSIISFKSANEGNDGFISYLSGLITSSALFSNFSGHQLALLNNNISENTGTAQFKLSASFSDFDTASGLINPKYSIECEPSRWIYELIPAANIEGVWVIQDIQAKSNPKTSISINTETTGTKSRDIWIISGISDTISGIYIGQNGFLINQNISSGSFNTELSCQYIGSDLQGSDLTSTKVVGSFGNQYVRQAGFSFGY